jgi:hypothetical protein
MRSCAATEGRARPATPGHRLPVEELPRDHGPAPHVWDEWRTQNEIGEVEAFFRLPRD